MAHIIVSGNEKGGSGKTTSIMHLLVSLLRLNFKVASIDLDIRQQSLSSYIQNRAKFAASEDIALRVPDHHTLKKSVLQNIKESENEEEESFVKLLESLKLYDFILIDTPGSDTFLSRLAHSHADTVITPINDSFVDVDLLGKIEANNLEVAKPGIYSAMVWEQKLKKAAREKKQMDWVVLRNRVASTDNINKRNIEEVMGKLSKKFGFRVAPGFGERVIFRELFLYGLTLHDAGLTPRVRFNTSIIAARQELRDFITMLKLPNVEVGVAL